MTLFGLALLGTWRKGSRALAIWTWLPVLLLSLLPHKEPRYLIPVVPFVSLLAIAGLTQALMWTRAAGSARAWAPALIVTGAILGVAQDAAHWRLPRTDEDVRLAWRLPSIAPAGSTVAVEQPWRMGGHLYLGAYDLVELNPALVKDPSYLGPHTSRASWVFLDGRHVGGFSVRGRSLVPTDFAQESGYVAYRMIALE